MAGRRPALCIVDLECDEECSPGATFFLLWDAAPRKRLPGLEQTPAVLSAFRCRPQVGLGSSRSLCPIQEHCEL